MLQYPLVLCTQALRAYLILWFIQQIPSMRIVMVLGAPPLLTHARTIPSTQAGLVSQARVWDRTFVLSLLRLGWVLVNSKQLSILARAHSKASNHVPHSESYLALS